MLAESGTIVLKFFLHISKDEQRKRLRERVDDPTKRWKFQFGDLDERKLWSEYQDAYERCHREDVDEGRTLDRRAGRPQVGAQLRRRRRRS